MDKYDGPWQRKGADKYNEHWQGKWFFFFQLFPGRVRTNTTGLGRGRGLCNGFCGEGVTNMMGLGRGKVHKIGVVGRV